MHCLAQAVLELYNSSLAKVTDYARLCADVLGRLAGAIGLCKG